VAGPFKSSRVRRQATEWHNRQVTHAPGLQSDRQEVEEGNKRSPINREIAVRGRDEVSSPDAPDLVVMLRLHDWGMPTEEIAGLVGASPQHVGRALAQRADQGMRPVVLRGGVTARLVPTDDDRRRWRSEAWGEKGWRVSEISIGDILKGACSASATQHVGDLLAAPAEEDRATF